MFWIKVVKVANGIFAFFAFLEIIWILSRARHGKKFMQNWQFYADHLKSNSDQQREVTAEETPFVQPQHQLVNIQYREEQLHNTERTMPPEHPEHPQAQTDFQRAIQSLKENCLTRTDKPSDLQQPFGRPYPGEKGDCSWSHNGRYLCQCSNPWRQSSPLLWGSRQVGHSSKNTHPMQRIANSQNQRTFLTKITRMFSLLAVPG